ncbi:ribosome maturation factor RimM [Ferrovibrio terrae]|uniref:Ribosome maturation factor RimM n=1 Tax=Ferrovibrio terrae TaxID=2594003 RepID=A0A516GYQ0_9PROT|nr:ribosome maturation factor RimM [Ferrovibrio terrae]QDO96470.1 ribosome maturation factor RimM [Ferrovibrio terrae]
MSGTLLLGVVIGAQGIQGEVKVKTFTGEPEAVGDYGPLQDATAARTFQLKVLRLSKGDVVIARIKGVEDRNAAEALKGTELYVLRSALPQADEGEFYFADLVGLTAMMSGRVLGSVSAVHNYGAGDMLEVKTDSGRSAMVPFTDDAVPVVDLAAGTVTVEPAFWLGAPETEEDRKDRAEQLAAERAAEQAGG